MKKVFTKKAIYTVLLGLSALTMQGQNVGIGTSTPAASAKLDISSTNSGFLLPRIHLVGVNDSLVPINRPATGLLVWNTNAALSSGTGFYYWNATQWVSLTESEGWTSTGNSATVSGVHFVGTTNNQALDFRVNNIIKTRLETNGTISILNTGHSVFIGENAGQGDDLNNNKNIYLGTRVGLNNTNGQNNIGLGYEALFNNTASSNIGVGTAALRNNTSGQFNTAMGCSALTHNIMGSFNIGLGCASLYYNTIGSGNIATGYHSMYNNITGSYNIATGYDALFSNITGVDNIAMGYATLYLNTTGTKNTAIGNYSMYRNISGVNNLAIGYDALYTNSTGSDNVSLGNAALFSNLIGNHNIGVGKYALFNNSVGNGNIATGYLTLNDNSSGSRNIAIGHGAFLFGNTFSNSIALGAYASVTASNQTRIGDASMSSIGGYVSWSNVSDKRFKTAIKEEVRGLDFINKLRPVTYYLDMNAIAQRLGMPDSMRDFEAEKIKSAVLQTGFIAQEVEAAAQALGYDFSGVDAPKNEKDHYALRYAEFTVPLVKSVQELDAENKALALENKEIKADLELLKNELIQIKNSLQMD